MLLCPVILPIGQIALFCACQDFSGTGILSTMKRIYFLIALLLSCTVSPSLGWGDRGHQYVNSLAIDLLPNSIKPFYEENRAWVVTHSIDPDLWKREYRIEAPKHFIDLDTWGNEIAQNYPSDYWLACGLLGKAAVDKNGTVPWRIAEYYGKLVNAFRKRDARGVVEISAWLGHYVGDIHVPFHAAANYDGQLSGQKGLHVRFETEMLNRQITPDDLKQNLTTRKPVRNYKSKNLVEEAFGWARESLRLTTPILDADKSAAQGGKNYDDAYYQAFGAKTRSIALSRLQEAGRQLSWLWVSAWQEAGSPALTALDTHAGEPLSAPTHDPDMVEPTPRTRRP